MEEDQRNAAHAMRAIATWVKREGLDVLRPKPAFPSYLSPTDRSVRLPFGDQFLVRG